MKIDELNNLMQKNLENFKDNMKFEVETKGDEPLNKYDLETISKQTFYALDDFRQAIIQYLSDKDNQ